MFLITLGFGGIASQYEMLGFLGGSAPLPPTPGVDIFYNHFVRINEGAAT